MKYKFEIILVQNTVILLFELEKNVIWKNKYNVFRNKIQQTIKRIVLT